MAKYPDLIEIAKFSKGNRVVIPPHVVRKLNLSLGDRVGFYDFSGNIVIKKVRIIPYED